MSLTSYIPLPRSINPTTQSTFPRFDATFEQIECFCTRCSVLPLGARAAEGHSSSRRRGGLGRGDEAQARADDRLRRCDATNQPPSRRRVTLVTPLTTSISRTPKLHTHAHAHTLTRTHTHTHSLTLSPSPSPSPSLALALALCLSLFSYRASVIMPQLLMI